MEPSGTTRVEAQKFLPEDMKFGIYKDLKNKRWQGYNTIFGSTSRAFLSHTDRGAMLGVLKWIWTCYKSVSGRDCPYKFLAGVDASGEDELFV